MRARGADDVEVFTPAEFRKLRFQMIDDNYRDRTSKANGVQ